MDNSHPSLYKPEICHGSALGARRPAAPPAEGGGGRGGRAAGGDARAGGRRDFRWNCSRCGTAVLGDSDAVPGHGGRAATEATTAPPAAAEAALRGWEVAAPAGGRALAAGPLRAPLASQERGGGGMETALSETVEAEGVQLRGGQRAQVGDKLRVVSPVPSCPGICLIGFCLCPPHRETTSRLKDAASARLSELPRAAGHLLATL